MAGDNKELLLLVGRVLTGVERLREDFNEEKRNAQTSRTKLYERTDELSEELNTLKTNVAISGQVSAMVRDEVKGLKNNLADHKAAIQPSIDDWKRLKALGYGMSGLILLAGLSATTIFTSVLEAVRSAFKNWFG